MKIAPYLVVLVITMFIDSMWLWFMVPRVYQDRIGSMLADHVRYMPAFLFYILYAFGIYYFIVNPFLNGQMNMKQLLVGSMIFGLVAYGTYDLTNYATLKQWSGVLTIIDMAWGASLTFLVAYITVRIFS